MKIVGTWKVHTVRGIAFVDVGVSPIAMQRAGLDDEAGAPPATACYELANVVRSIAQGLDDGISHGVVLLNDDGRCSHAEADS